MSEQRFNRAHISTRNCIERALGAWKQRFLCLGRTLRFRPRRCCIIIEATAVLHNFAVDQAEPVPPITGQTGDTDDHQDAYETTLDINSTRQHVITNFFSN